MLLHWIANLDWEGIRAYASTTVLALISFYATWKDEADYRARSQEQGKTSWLPKRKAVVFVYVLTAIAVVFGFADLHSSRKRAEQDRIDAEKKDEVQRADIEQLTKQVADSRQDAYKANEGFRQSFAELYKKFSDLQAKVTNQELMKELVDTKKQVEAYQKKLAEPPPKASLVAGFNLPGLDIRAANEIPALMVQDTTAKAIGNTIEITVTVFNSSSSVVAVNGGLTVRICTLCKYAEEPPGTIHVRGSEPSDREKPFQHIFPQTFMETLTLKVSVPPEVGRAGLSLSVACETCEAPTMRNLWVNVTR